MDDLFEEETAHYRTLVVKALPTIDYALTYNGKCKSKPNGKTEDCVPPSTARPFLLKEPDYVGPVFAREIDQLLVLQNDRRERIARSAEIQSEIDDIYSPFIDELTNVTGPPSGVLRILNLMDMAGYVIAYYYKRRFGRLRPHIADPRIDPLIGVPSHSSYPSAHATQTHLIAHALTEIYGADTAAVAELFDTAERISVNREYAGVHYRSDTEAGMLIAQVAFPFLRCVFDEVFMDAIADVNTSAFVNCRFAGELPTSEASGGQSEIVKPVLPQGMTANLRALWGKQASASVEVGETKESDDLNKPKTSENQEEQQPDPSKPETTGQKWFGEGSMVLMVDKAVQIRHPAIEHAFYFGDKRPASGPKQDGAEGYLFDNLDYPVPAGDLWTMESKGAAHGTAMAGLIAGRIKAPDGSTQLQIGVAPEANIAALRALNFVRNNHDDRMHLAGSILIALFSFFKRKNKLEVDKDCLSGEKYSHRIDVLLLSLDFQRPLPNQYVDVSAYAAAANDVQRQAVLDRADDVCDPLALVILIAQTLVPVVIASGNSGGDKLAYPAAPSDYHQIFEAMEFGSLRDKMAEMLRLMLSGFIPTDKEEIPADLEKLEAAAKSFLTGTDIQSFGRPAGGGRGRGKNANDEFIGTGIVVVGASDYREKNDNGEWVPTRYSQYGNGLCVLAPGDADFDRPPKDCRSWETFRRETASSLVTTADIPGPGGFAEDPDSLYSLEGQAYGFGGTSAASAQVAGVLALLVEKASKESPPRYPTPAELRFELIALAKASNYDSKRGWGAIDLRNLK